MSDDEKAPVVQETMQVIETPEGLDKMFEGMVEQSVKVSEKAKNSAVGSRKYLISQIRELCGKVDVDPKSFKLSRCKKVELKQILLAHNRGFKFNKNTARMETYDTWKASGSFFYDKRKVVRYSCKPTGL